MESASSFATGVVKGSINISKSAVNTSVNMGTKVVTETGSMVQKVGNTSAAVAGSAVKGTYNLGQRGVNGTVNMSGKAVMGTVNAALKATDLTINTTYKAGTMTREAAGTLKDFSSSLVVDTFSIVMVGDTIDGEEKKLPPISITPSCVPHEPKLIASREMITALGFTVNESIKTMLEHGADKCRAMPTRPTVGISGDKAVDNLQNLYTLLLSCILFPQMPATAEELQMWAEDEYKGLRAWVGWGACRDRERVGGGEHVKALEFLESYEGKNSLMAGFLARHQLINMNPFYGPPAFATPRMFENWKMSELQSLERQKQVLVKFNKTELVVEVLSVRSTEKLRVETLGQAVRDPVGAVVAANSSMVGMGKMMLNKTVDTTKTYGSLFTKNPLTAAVKGTKSLLTTSVDVTKKTLMSPATVTQALSRTRADMWCRITFAGLEHTSQVVGDVTSEEPEVELKTGVSWQVRPNESGALSVELLRKRKFAVEMKEAEEEVLGSIMWCWDDLFECGQLGRPLEGWFNCSEGNFDEHGFPVQGERDVNLRVELLTKPIDGTGIPALFHPRDDVHSLYTNLYMSLSPGMDLMPPPGVEWLLNELRLKCGISRRWHHLLRLAAGLNLQVSGVSEREEALQVREGRLVALLGSIRDCGSERDESADASILQMAVGLRQALRLIQGQVRNGLLMFPYKLAQGPEHDEEYQEPMELRLLCQIDAAVTEELQAQERLLPELATHKMAVHPSAHVGTEEVLAEGLRRFVGLFYQHHLQTALAKDKANGKTQVPEVGGVWRLPDGEVMGKHVKVVIKRSTVLVQRLHDKFAQVLPLGVMRRAVEELVSTVTVDVLSLIAAYHLRGQSSNAFQEGSEEAMLLKLHMRANHLRHLVSETHPEVASDGLATATSPLLSDWIKKTLHNMERWIAQATSTDSWSPAAGLEVGGPSSSLIDVFSAAEHACNTFLGVRMAVQVSLRVQFLELLHQVCVRYMAAINDFAREEHALISSRRNALLKTTGGASSHRNVGMRLGMVSFQALHHLPFMDGLLPVRVDKQEATPAGVHADHEADAVPRKSSDSITWEERGEHVLEKLEDLAESAVSVSAWKKGLGALGRKSLSASRTITRTSVSVATLGQVKVLQDKELKDAHDAGGGAEAGSGAGQRLPQLTPKDFFDGEPLLSGSACTRLSNVVNVKLQLDTLLGLLEADDDFAGRSAAQDAAADGLQVPSEWIHSEMYENKTAEMYNAVRESTEQSVDLELRPVLQWLGPTIAAALTDEGGSVENAHRTALEQQLAAGVHLHEGQKVVRGPDWKWGNQDGFDEDSGVPAVGVVLAMKGSGWCKVRWASSIQETYRVGAEGGKYDVIPLDMPKPREILAPAVAAIEDALEETLAMLRSKVGDRGFSVALRGVWVACVSVLETCLVNDVTGNIKAVRRARDLLERLRNYLHADGSGLPTPFMNKTSEALAMTIAASLT